MEAQRVLAVQGPVSPGSGYVLAAGLVLTSAHVVGEVGRPVEVFLPGRPDRYRGVVVWRGRPGGRDDAALVDVDDPSWVAPSGAVVRWGRTVTYRARIGCETWGWPDLVQRPGRAADTRQLSGTLNPGDRFVGDRYVMSLDGHPPTPRRDGGSPWGGLSGAAVFCGDLLAGVIVSDPEGAGHSELEAVPAYVLHRDPSFRAVLAAHTGRSDAVLEPIEWQELADAALLTVLSRRIASPAGLLPARLEVVPFRGRVELLRDLRMWTARPGFAAWLLHGPGGQGKTRLAQHIAAELAAEGWTVLWLDSRASADLLRVLKDAATPLLIVVDYAETRTEQLTAVVDACARHQGGTPIKVLLLARTAGSWWQTVRESSSVVETLLEGAVVVALAALEPEAAGRAQAYREAVDAFATALPCVEGQQDQPWSELAARLPAPAVRRLETALTLHMTALADLLDAADRTAGDGAGDGAQLVEDRLLGHERRYWTAAVKTHALALSIQTLTDALAAAVLCGATNRDQADGLLRRVPGLTDQTRDVRDTVRTWIAALYPPAGALPWGTLQPDRLAERFIGRHLHDNPSLADHLVSGANQVQATQLLTVYARAAAHPVFNGTLDNELASLCVRHPAELATAAIDVATQIEAPRPLFDGLQQVIDDPTLDVSNLQRLNDHLPESSHVLADWAARLTQRLVDEYRQLAHDDPDAFLPNLAASLNALSTDLSALGRQEDALAAITEAVDIRRQLAQARPVTYLSGLASSLANLLADLGQREDALAAITEAIDAYEELDRARPDTYTYTPYFASLVNNFSLRLADLGRQEDALAAITGAVDIDRLLAEAQPDAYLPKLAMSLHNLAIALGELGRQEDALAAITEAVNIRRELAQARPDAYLPKLALSLNTLSNRLAAVERREDALAAITAAVEVYRELAQARPDAYLPNLAGVLNNLSNRLEKLERREDALATITEAVDIRRELAQARPDAFLPDLAASLHNLAITLRGLGRQEDAVAAVTEAIDILRELARARPDAFLPDLAASLHNLAVFLEALGRQEDAVAAITEAVDIGRPLAEARPAVHQRQLEKSLLILASLQNNVNDEQDSPS